MRRSAALCAVLLASVALVIPAGTAAAAPVAPQECNASAGAARVAAPWPQQRLNFTRAWSVSRGKGVVVGVIDSGLNTSFSPQLAKMSIKPGRNIIGGTFKADDTRDCYGHGTAVTSILAAQPSSTTSFVGIAPDVTVVPIKWSNLKEDKTGTSAGIGTGIDTAMAAGATVINISIATTTPTPVLEAAVRRAARRDVVIVAAAGNDGAGQNLPAYPAAYSTKYPNVIAVSASNISDGIGDFSESGRYVTVAAPGVKVPAAAGRGGYTVVDGTSFATPYVTGTVALLRAAFKNKMTAEQIRDRITATADAPPATVPDSKYGYGIVNPYLAVTSLREGGPVGAPTTAAPLAAPKPAAAPDHSLQNRALAIALALLGLVVLTIVAMVVLRSRRRPARP